MGLLLDDVGTIDYSKHALIVARSIRRKNTMDPRLRNRGWLKLGLTLVVCMVGGVIVALLRWSAADPRHPGSNVTVLAILFNFTAQALVIWGSMDLANAKGHGSEIVAVIVVFCFIFIAVTAFIGQLLLGVCIGTTLFLGMPVIILVGLDDKNRRGRHRRH
jgi:hypothetical protein